MTNQRRADLLVDHALPASTVVANCAVNRARQVLALNGDARELGFSPVRRREDR